MPNQCTLDITLAPYGCFSARCHPVIVMFVLPQVQMKHVFMSVQTVIIGYPTTVYPNHAP